MIALDDKRAQGRSRITSHAVGGCFVTTLDPPINFAYAVDRVRRRLILSTSSDAIVRYLEIWTSHRAASVSVSCGPRHSPTPLRTRASISIASTSSPANIAPACFKSCRLARTARPTRLIVTLLRCWRWQDSFEPDFVTSQLHADATAVHRSARVDSARSKRQVTARDGSYRWRRIGLNRAVDRAVGDIHARDRATGPDIGVDQSVLAERTSSNA